MPLSRFLDRRRINAPQRPAREGAVRARRGRVIARAVPHVRMVILTIVARSVDGKPFEGAPRPSLIGTQSPSTPRKSMADPCTISELLAAGSPSSVAIRALDARPLTYASLRDQVERTVAALNGFGIGRDDRVAIVLPNGPEMAVAFVAIAAGATPAPLNPPYPAAHFPFS